jgi:small subunit ribosomal protein S9
VAQVRLIPGTGTTMINGKPLESFFPRLIHRKAVLEPLETIDRVGKVDVTVKVAGGGCSGQAGAIRHGLARALVRMDESLRTSLRSVGSLTRDSRIKERKKYGLKRARKAPQYTKR